MANVIKGFINNIIVDGDVAISNKTIHDEESEKLALAKEQEEAAAAAEGEEGAQEANEAKEERFTVDYAQLEALKEQYRQEGEEQVKYLVQRSEEELAKAKERADEMIANAKLEASAIIAKAQTEVENTLAEAEQSGFDSGFAEGRQQGVKEGFDQGVRKCQATLAQLEKLCAAYGNEKNELMAENRRSIFDLSQEIAEKITMTVFTQKSKNILEKMIASAAKDFRKAKNVKVTLSKLDITEEFIADSELLQKCFPSAENVEFEVLDDAERGTLMIDADSEILDAGVSTQLKMIGELGRGKFREKEPEKPASHTPQPVLPANEEKEEEKPKQEETEQPVLEENIPQPIEEKEEKEPEQLIQQEIIPEPAAEAVEPPTKIDEPIAEPVAEPAEPVMETIEPVPSEFEEGNIGSDISGAADLDLADDLLENMDAILGEAKAALEAAEAAAEAPETAAAAEPAEIDDSILENMDDILGEAEAALAAAEASQPAITLTPDTFADPAELNESENQENAEEKEKEAPEPKKSRKKNKEEE